MCSILLLPQDQPQAAAAAAAVRNTSSSSSQAVGGDHSRAAGHKHTKKAAAPATQQPAAAGVQQNKPATKASSSSTAGWVAGSSGTNSGSSAGRGADGAADSSSSGGGSRVSIGLASEEILATVHPGEQQQTTSPATAWVRPSSTRCRDSSRCLQPRLQRLCVLTVDWRCHLTTTWCGDPASPICQLHDAARDWVCRTLPVRFPSNACAACAPAVPGLPLPSSGPSDSPPCAHRIEFNHSSLRVLLAVHACRLPAGVEQLQPVPGVP